MITHWTKEEGAERLQIWIVDRDENGKMIDNSGVPGEYYEEYCKFRLREERDKLLKDSDWTVFNDSPLSDEVKAKWATYRQSLRDLPENCTPTLNYPRPMQTETKLVGVTWPEKPKEAE